MKHAVREVTLRNGAKGLLIDVPDAQVMTFDFNFRAGDYLVKKEKWETPHLMEHLLLGANEAYPKARLFQAEVEKNGAYSNASTSSYQITYEAECADFEWDRIMTLMLEAIAKPLFLEDEFIAEVGNVREELYSRSNNHFRHLNLALHEAYGFYALTDQERLKLMDNVTLEDVRSHYAATHTTSNMRFVVCGKITGRASTIIKAVEDIDLPEGKGRIALPIEVPKTITKPLYIVNSTIENIYFYMDTFVLRRLKDTEQDALSLLNNMLTETFHSRILGEARERGLVYHVGSGFSHAKENVAWWFGAQVMPKNAEALFEIIIRELKRVMAGEIEDSDLAAAKAYALGRYQRSGQTVGGTGNGYSGRYFFEDVIDDYYKIPDRIQAVTKNAVVKAARAMFADGVWGMGFLGNCGEELTLELQKQISGLWHTNSK